MSAHRAGGAYARPPVFDDEPERQAALAAYEIMDTPEDPAFDDLTFLASLICETPVAMVSLVDGDRQWFKSRVGIDLKETPKDVAFCAHAIAMKGTMIVPDAHADERFRHNPLVVGEPQIRFYAGSALRNGEGHALGALCVIDRKPRQLTLVQMQALDALSRQVMAQMELRRQMAEMKRLAGQLPYCRKCGKLRVDIDDTCPACR